MKKEVTLAKKQIAVLDAYKKVFAGPDGDIVLHDLMKKAGVLDPIYTDDVNQMLVREGARQFVLRILKDLHINVEQFRERVDEYARENR